METRKNTLLSVIVPAYNVEACLPRCLASLLDQDPRAQEECEVLVVNDGSTDGTLAVAEAFAHGNLPLRIISQENGGLSRARNAGLDAARGEYVWFVDADDSLVPGCLGPLLRRCRADGPDILALGRKRWRGAAEAETFQCSLRQEKALVPGKEALRKGWMQSVCAPFHIFRREFLRMHALRFPPGMLHEDEAFTPLCYYLAARVGFVRSVCYITYARAGSITHTPNPKRVLDMLSIANGLADYARQLPPRDSRLFSRRIAELANQVMKCSFRFPALQNGAQGIRNQVFERRRIPCHMMRSGIPKYFLAGLLAWISPRLASALYALFFATNDTKHEHR